MNPSGQGPFSFQVRDPIQQPSPSAGPNIGSLNFNQNKESVPRGALATATASSRSNLPSSSTSRFNISVPSVALPTASSRLNLFSRSATRFNASAPTRRKENNQSQDESSSSESFSSGKKDSQPDSHVRPSPSSAPEPENNQDSEPYSNASTDEEKQFDAGCERTQDILDGLWEMSKAPRQLQIELDKLRRDQKSTWKKLRKERDRSERLEEKLEAMRIALEASRTAAQSSTIKADEAHNAKKNLSVRFHKLQEQVKLLEDAVAVEKSEHEQTKATLAAKLEQHKVDLHEKDIAHRKVEKELEYAQKQFEDVVVKGESLTAERDYCHKEVTNLREQIIVLENKVISVNKIIEDERNCSSRTIANQKDIIDKIQLESNQHQGKIENLQSSLHCCEAEASRLHKALSDTRDGVLAIKALQKDFNLAVQRSFKNIGLCDIFSSVEIACFLLEQSPDQHGQIREEDSIDISEVSNHVALVKDNLAIQLSNAAQRDTIFSSYLSEVKIISDQFKGPLLRAKEIVEVTRHTIEASRGWLDAALQKVGILSQSIYKIPEKWLARMTRAEEHIDKLVHEKEGMNKEFVSCKAVLRETQQELQSVEKEKKDAFDEHQKKLKTCEDAREDILRELERYRQAMQERMEELQRKNGVTESALNEAKTSLKSETLERTRVLKELEESLAKVKNAEEEVEQATQWAYDVRAGMEKKVDEIKKEKSTVVAEKERLQAELVACASKLAAASQTGQQFKSQMYVREAILSSPQATNMGVAEVSQEVEQVLSPVQGICSGGKSWLASHENASAVGKKRDGIANESVIPDANQDAHRILRSKSRKRQQRGSADKVTKMKRSRAKSLRAAGGNSTTVVEKEKRLHITDEDDDSDWMVRDSTLGI